MTCAICKHGNLETGSVTVTLERASALLIFKNVPARVCDTCGEEFVSSEVNRALLRQAEEELRRGVKLEMLEFAA
jgi:YgiT-type zinc finger domain-containing protein